MSRTPSPLVLALTLTCGLLAGLLLGRGGPSLSAQPAPLPPPPPVPATAPVVAPGGTPAPVQRTALLDRGKSEDAIYDELAQQYSRFEQVNRTFEMVACAVSPAVVHIVAEKTGPIEGSPRVRHYEETGSGVIVRADRARGLFVLTNNHVVEKASAAKISIFRQDGSVIHPDQVWLDPKADIAVLRLTRDDLPSARLGNSDEATVGTWVLAMGSPFGLMHSVSQGIISARGRHMDELQDVENQDFLQTDAAINPGNSGGPLVNLKGQVVGINNSIASNGGGNEGVGFSIPINLARWIMNQLIAQGHVSRGALGVDLHPEFRPEDAQALGLDRPRGAWVDVVHSGSPAAKAGLRDGDVILRFRGVEVADLNHLINMVSMAPIGQPVDLVLWRERQSVSVRATVGDRDRTIAAATPTADPAPAAAASSGSPADRNALLRRPERPARPSESALGVELQTLDEATARRLGLPPTLHGAVILNVTPGSPLASALRPNDVIHSVNGREVAASDEATRALGGGGRAGQAEGMTVGFYRVEKGAVQARTARVR